MAGIGDPGGEDAVRVVDEVVARKCVDALALAAPVRDGDGDELAVAGGRRNALRPGEQPVAIACEQGRRDEDHGIDARA